MNNLQEKFKQFESIISQYPIIDKKLLFSIIMTESGGNPYACRYEPEYDYLVTPKLWAKRLGTCSVETMEKMQMTSMGLMQVMGGKYYELGGQGWATEMFNPEISIKYGVKVLERVIKRYGDDSIKDIYAAYNAGSVIKLNSDQYNNQKNVNNFWDIYNRCDFLN